MKERLEQLKQYIAERFGGLSGVKLFPDPFYLVLRDVFLRADPKIFGIIGSVEETSNETVLKFLIDEDVQEMFHEDGDSEKPVKWQVSALQAIRTLLDQTYANIGLVAGALEQVTIPHPSPVVVNGMLGSSELHPTQRIDRRLSGCHRDLEADKATLIQVVEDIVWGMGRWRDGAIYNPYEQDRFDHRPMALRRAVVYRTYEQQDRIKAGESIPENEIGLRDAGCTVQDVLRWLIQPLKKFCVLVDPLREKAEVWDWNRNHPEEPVAVPE